MKTFVERKQKLCEIINGYTALCDRLGGEYKEYKTRKEEMLSLGKAIQRERYYIGLIGFLKRGKSTLLNAMLGTKDDYNISPVKNLACTAAIVKYFDSALHPEEKEEVIINYSDDRSPDKIPKKDLPMYVDQQAEGFKEDRAKEIECIEVYGKYPLIETRGVFVDTPGRGAVLDQDYLVDLILPDVDIILCPVAADYPLAQDEKDFIRNKLTETEQKKLVFLLTKTDAKEISADELEKVYSDVQNFAASILGDKPKVHKVAAKKVLDAYKEGKNEAETKTIKEKYGMKELEEALDKKLRNTSKAEDDIREARKKLENYFADDKKEWEEMRQTLSRTAGELEKEKEDLNKEYSIVKKAFEKGRRKLENDWENVFEDFIGRLEGKDSDILERLSHYIENEISNGNILSLVGYKKKMARRIQNILGRELRGDLEKLEEKFKVIVKKFNNDLKSDIENDPFIQGRYKSKSDPGGEISTFLGGGIALTGGLFGATTVVSTVTAISAAASTALTAAGEAAAKTGFVPWVSRLFGVGKAAEATGGAIIAKTGIFTAVVNGIVPLAIGISVTVIAYRLGTKLAKGVAEKNIPKMIEKQIQEASATVKKSADNMLKKYLDMFEEHQKQTLAEKNDKLDKIIETINANDTPARVEEIERNLQELDKLKKELISLSNAS